MPPVFGRDRKRSSPVPPSNKLEAGRLYVVKADTGEHLWLDRINYTETNSVPSYRETTRDQINPGPPYRNGGPFTNVKLIRPQHTLLNSGTYMGGTYFGDPTRRWKYVGGFYDPLWILSDPIAESVYNSLGYTASTLYPDLATLGAGAYARLKPKLEGVGLGVALAEAKDIPKMLRTSASGFHNAWKALGGGGNTKQMAPKKVSDQYLNHQFGWVPFINDMLSLDKTYQNAAAMKAQIKRDNGSWIRRQRTDTRIESEVLKYSRTDIPGCQPRGTPYDSIYKNGTFLYTVTLQDITEVWYEGVFKYYRPEFDDKVPWSNSMYGAIMRDMTLYGAHINPTVVWKATPWSWLADWFSNAGEGITRIQEWATDSMLSKYMYLMHHRLYRYKLQSQFTLADGRTFNLIWYRAADIKRREEASSHWNFSLSADLSARQLAILAALGISRT